MMSGYHFKILGAKQTHISINFQYKTFHMFHHIMNQPYHISIYPCHDIYIYIRLEISRENSPRDGTRLQAPRSPQLGQGIFNSEDGRLGVLRPPRASNHPGDDAGFDIYILM